MLTNDPSFTTSLDDQVNVCQTLLTNVIHGVKWCYQSGFHVIRYFLYKISLYRQIIGGGGVGLGLFCSFK